jgi:hypothetical protein
LLPPWLGEACFAIPAVRTCESIDGRPYSRSALRTRPVGRTERSPGVRPGESGLTTMSAEGATQSECRSFGPRTRGLPVTRPHGRGYSLPGLRPWLTVSELLCQRNVKTPLALRASTNFSQLLTSGGWSFPFRGRGSSPPRHKAYSNFANRSSTRSRV